MITVKILKNSRIVLFHVLLASLFVSVGGCTQADSAASRVGSSQTSSEGVLFPNQSAIVEQAATWLIKQHQNEDGGFSSFSVGANMAPSDVGGTVDALLALSAASRVAPIQESGGPAAALAYLTANMDQVEAYAKENGGQIGKLLLALSALGVNPRDFEGQDLVKFLTDQHDQMGAFGVGDAFKQSLAILGLAAAKENVPESATDWLVTQQAGNGSWDDGFGTVDNPDATAMAIMALIASGYSPVDEPVSKAIEFLKSSQERDGGWGYAPGFGSSANTTSLVAQALTSLGENWTDNQGTWSNEGQSPLTALLSFQSDSGAFQADFGQGPFDDFFSTVQAMPAIAGLSLPIQPD